MVGAIKIDLEINLKDVDWEIVHSLEDFEPFGIGNPKPLFVSKKVKLIDMQKVGNDGKHLRLMVQQEETTRKVIAFGFGDTWGNELKIGDDIDVVYEISVNEWNGNRELQMKLVDLKLSK